MCGKAVGEHLHHAISRDRVCINVYFSKLTVWPDIVHASYVIIMCMSNQYAMNATERLWQNLFSEVWSDIHQNPCGISLYQNGTA